MCIILLFDISALNTENITIAVVGYVIVFFALVVLYFVFSSIPKIINLRIRKRLLLKGDTQLSEERDFSIQGPVAVAIAMALYTHLNEIHDDEDNVMTIKRVARVYSPWSSKIHGMKSFTK